MGTKNSDAKGQDPGNFFTSIQRGWRKLRKGQKFAIIFAAAFLVLIGTGIWYYQSVLNNPDTLIKDKPIFDNNESKEITSTKDSDAELEKYVPEEYFESNIVNFALLGFDTNDERRQMDDYDWGSGFIGARPDSIRVVSVNLDTMSASVISIPRDTYIQIADTSTKQKINASYMYGRMNARKNTSDEEEINAMGIQYVCQSISNVLGGVPIDYYVAIDFDTIVNFVDEIGGVDYYVEHDIYHPNGTLMLEEGQQTLNGTQAFIYLQDRKNVGSDFARTTNHTKFLMAMVKQLKQTDKLVEAIKFITLGGLGTVQTDMSAEEILTAGNLVRQMDLSSDNIKTYMVEGRGQSMDGISYVTMVQSKRAALIKEVFGFDIPKIDDEILHDTVPAPPTNFTASITADGVVLDWNPGDSHNIAFNLWRNGTQIATGLTEDLFLDAEYPKGQLVYEVQAVNGDAVSTKVSVSLQAGPPMPTNLQASFDADTASVDLTWDYSDDRATFTIYKSDGDGSGARLVRNLKDESYSDSKVDYGKTYTYRVVAVNDGIESEAATVQILIDGASPSPSPSPTPTPSPTPEVTPTPDPATPTPDPATPTPDPATPTPEPTPTPTPTTYTFSLGVNPGEEAFGSPTASPSGSGPYPAGTEITLAANPATGYHLDHWAVTGGTLAGNKVTITGNCTVTAFYAAD